MHTCILPISIAWHATAVLNTMYMYFVLKANEHTYPGKYT